MELGEGLVQDMDNPKDYVDKGKMDYPFLEVRGIGFNMEVKSLLKYVCTNKQPLMPFGLIKDLVFVKLGEVSLSLSGFLSFYHIGEYDLILHLSPFRKEIVDESFLETLLLV